MSYLILAFIAGATVGFLAAAYANREISKILDQLHHEDD